MKTETDELNIFAGADPYDDDAEPVTPAERGDLLPGDVGDGTAAPDGDPQPSVADPTAEPAEPGEPPADGEPGETTETTPAEPAEDAPKPKPKAVPYDRFKDVNDRRKSAEARVTELEAQIAKDKQPPAPKEGEQTHDQRMAELRAQYHEAILDNKMEAATELANKISATERDHLLAELHSRTGAQGREDRVTELRRDDFTATAGALEQTYPFLAEGSDSFKPEVVQEAMELFEGLWRSGKYTMPGAALEKAVAYVVREHGLEPTTDSTPTPPPVKKSDIASKVAAAAAQPPASPSGGTAPAEGPVDVDNISEEEWDALPESTRAKLRGDFLS